MKELKGKTAIVTGAASGIGAATAVEFARLGMNVVLADIQSGPLAATRQKLTDMGAPVSACVTDVSDPDAVQALAEHATQRFGDVHVAFNNAGVAMHGTPMVDIALADWSWVIDVNIRGMIHCIRSFTPLLQRHGGEAHIVNTASIGGLQVNPAWLTGAYSATKHAAVALSEGLQQELSGTKIGVSVLCPSAVATQLGEGSSRPERLGGATQRPQQQFLKDAIAGGMKPERVAQLVVAGIRDEQFFIFTDSSQRKTIEARHVAIQQAFVRADRLAAEVNTKS